MLTVFSIMIVGALCGYFLRRKKNIKIIGKLITGLIFLLLFFLGIAVGHNKTIINNMNTIGLQALVITLAAVFGSVLLAWAVYKEFFDRKKEKN